MQITILNSEKIKVSLSCEDLEKYSLTVDDMDYETTKMRRALWTILDEVRCSTGFDGAKEKIKVRVYPTEKADAICTYQRRTKKARWSRNTL